MQVTYIDSGIIDEQTSMVANVHVLVAVGFLVHEGDDCIVLAREYDVNERDWRGQIAIPNEAIKASIEISMTPTPSVGEK